MVGREVIFHIDKKDQEPGEVVLEVSGVCKPKMIKDCRLCTAYL